MKQTKIVHRREFLKSSVAVGMGFYILPSGVLSGANAPSNKLNIAMIGTWGRAHAHFKVASSENVVALCDVDENHIASAALNVTRSRISIA